MQNEVISWDDLQYLLQVTRTGSISAAANQLGVNRTTVLRRINRLEEVLDYALFDRRVTGYWLVSEAEELLQVAQEVEERISQLHRQIKNKDVALQGELRIATTDPVLHMFLAPHLASFREKHPNIRMNILVANHQMSPGHREVDISVRALPIPSEDLVSKKLMPLEFGIYGSIDYLKENNSADIAEHRWIGTGTPASGSQTSIWLAEKAKNKICFRIDTFTGIRTAVDLGIGLGIIPVPLAEQYPHLKRVFAPEPGFALSLWIVTHPDLVNSTRVAAFYEHICKAAGVES